MFEINPEHLNQDTILQFASHHPAIALAVKQWNAGEITWEQATYFVILRLLQDNNELNEMVQQMQSRSCLEIRFPPEEHDRIIEMVRQPSTLTLLEGGAFERLKLGITEEQAYERLGLMDPDRFAQQATNPPMRTGRTTQMLVRAVVKSQADKVAIVGRTVNETRELLVEARRMCLKLRLLSTNLIGVSHLSSVDYIRRQHPKAWVFVDHDKISRGLFEIAKLPQLEQDSATYGEAFANALIAARQKLYLSDAVRGREITFAVRIHPDDLRTMQQKGMSFLAACQIRQAGAVWKFADMHLFQDGECDRGIATVVEHLEESYRPLVWCRQ